MFELNGKYASALVTIDNVEAECTTQITEFLNHPIYEGCKIAIMPDTHAGKGSVIGFTCTLSDKGISPNVVGVDIACGMSLWEIETPNLWDRVDKNIRRAIPLGMSQHVSAVETMKNGYPWIAADKDVAHFVTTYNKKFSTSYETPTINYEWYVNLSKKLVSNGQTIDDFLGRVDRSIGTLGGGNHFLEISSDNRGQHYLIIHSGSRNFGKRVADYYQKLAESQEYNNGFSKDLAYLKGQDAIDYFVAMVFTKHFASLNRETMGFLFAKNCDSWASPKIETIHNFVDDRDFTIRKGAIRSYVGEKSVIPFNMRDGSWIVEGKSNTEWNSSAPHGAGRVMSRSQAKRVLNLENYKKQMEGIYTTSVCLETLDEAPDSYKPAKVIQDAIGDTATIIHQLRPVYNLKSSEDNAFGRRKKKFTNNGNTPDSVWSRVKETLPNGTVTPENEVTLRKEFEQSPRIFCEKYR